MADLVRIKCGELGDREEMPTLQYDAEKGCELGYRTDESALYIGTNNGNKRLCGVNDVAELNNKINSINTEIRAIENLIANITTRLEKLEKPSE